MTDAMTDPMTSDGTTRGLHAVVGNHMEVLAMALAEWLHHGAANLGIDPLDTETVLVQSLGMQRWLSMAIAQHNGICANVEFPFPNAFLQQLYRRIMGPLPEAGHYYDALPLSFAILKQLPEVMSDPRFSDVHTYVVRDAHPLKEFQLAHKISDVFDQYLVFRPDMITAWESGKDYIPPAPNQWQPVLWRNLTKGIHPPHRAAMQQRLVKALEKGSATGQLPRRLAVFGISHLPPFHLDVLDALARHIPVYLFLMNPCRQYWADIFSDRQKARALQQEQLSTALTDAELYFERGNRLLSSWGGQGRQFFSLIHQMDIQATELFIENSSQTLLGRIQQDILDLEDRAAPITLSPTPPPEIAPGSVPETIIDHSVQIHICHSPMREVEVLYDQLLFLLDQHPDIEPRDVLVMTPDISTYTPYIQAVFGNVSESGIRIPFSVADQSIHRENRVIEAFLQILDLRDARFEVSRVMALLEYESIRRQFNIQAGDIETAEDWIRNVNIRWAWDGAGRKKHGLPGYSENTWRSGLDRLLLGYAMAGEEGRLFNETLPYDTIEGGQGHLLGNLIAFVQTLHASLNMLGAEASMDRWREILMQILDNLFWGDGSTISELQILRENIHLLADSARLAGFDRTVPFEVIRYQLGETFERNPQGTGFMNGGVTFCAMLPMRSIPAKVVCLIGMQHDAFPRDLREPVFNIMANDPKAGDRSKREDDTYLFLEALISARNTFYLSHVGRSQQDNADIPPSVLVDELTEYINDNFNIAPSLLKTQHPLQAFSAVNFNAANPRLFTYSRDNCVAGRFLQTPAQNRPFFDKPLSPPADAWRQCRLDQLTAFFSHPVRFIMEKRLNLFLSNQIVGIDDRENFNLNALDRHRMTQQMLGARLTQDGPKSTYAYYHAKGDLPHGTVGKVIYEQLDLDVAAFVRQLDACLPQSQPSSISVDFNIGAFQVTGELDAIYPQNRIVYRMAKLRPVDLLSMYIHHLALNLMDQTQTPCTSMLICKDRIWHFRPTTDARNVLERFLEIYWQGLHEPLPFFPRAAWAYAQKRHKGAGADDAMKSARQQWRENRYVPGWLGESEDAYNNRCFGHSDPLDAYFEDLALTIFIPILDAGEQTSL